MKYHGNFPAFPIVDRFYKDTGRITYISGMDLRTYIAAMAMQGQLANTRCDDSAASVDSIAEFSVQYADSLIDALNIAKIPKDEL